MQILQGKTVSFLMYPYQFIGSGMLESCSDALWDMAALLLLVTVLNPEWISLAGKSIKEAPSAPYVSKEQHSEIKKEHLTWCTVSLALP